MSKIVFNPLIVSPSWLSLFQDCPQKHNFKYGFGLGDGGGSAAQCLGKAVHKGVELYLVPQPCVCHTPPEMTLTPTELVPEFATKDYPEAFTNAKEWRTKRVAQGVIRGMAERYAVLTPAVVNGEVMVEVAIQRAIPIDQSLRDKLASMGYTGLELLCIVDGIIKQNAEYLVWERKSTGSTRIGEDGMPFIDPEKVEAGRVATQVAYECWTASGLLGSPIVHAIYEIVGIAKPLKAEPDKPRLAFDYTIVDYPPEAQGLALDEARDTVEDWCRATKRQRFVRHCTNCHNFNSVCGYWEICSAAHGLRQDTINAFPKMDTQEREKRHAKLKVHRVSE
jgi:hypothetical protein